MDKHYTNGVTKFSSSFEEWIVCLAFISNEALMKHRSGQKITINRKSAREWYDAGFTPEMTFRETFEMEDDCE